MESSKPTTRLDYLDLTHEGVTIRVKDQDDICNQLKLSPVQKLGQGKFSRLGIFQCLDEEDLGLQAVMKFHFLEPTKRGKTRKYFLQKELSILQTLDHPMIHNINCTYTYPTFIMTATLYHPRGDLTSLLSSLTEQDERFFFSQMACGVRYLHDNRVVHGDIRPGHFLITDNGDIQLTDFSMVRRIKEHQTTVVCRGGSKEYLAPEAGTLYKVDPFKVDMYALGVTFFNMSYRRLVKKGENPMMTVINKGTDYMTACILENLLHENPDKRWDARSLTKCLRSAWGYQDMIDDLE